MDIKWYKNHWYILSLAVSSLIIVIAVKVPGSFDFKFTGSDASFSFNINLLYRAIFNPLWAISLWLYDKGLKLNHSRHKEILLNIQGLLVGADKPNIPASKIYNIVFKYDNTEKSLNQKFDKEDSVSPTITSPIV